MASTPAQIIGASEDSKNHRYYIRAFLIDDSITKNKTGHVSEYLSQHINRFVGRPLIITDYLKHPHEFYHIPETGIPETDIKMYLERQRPYEIGVVSSVLHNQRLVQNAVVNSYDAIIELRDAKAIEAYKAGKIPKYVSPSIYRLNHKDTPDAITDFEPINITVVDDPAYGFHNANIKRACEGTNDVCTRLLTQNSSNSVDYARIKNLFQNSTTSTPNSSYFNFDANSNINLTEETSSNNTSSPAAQQQQQQPQQVTVEPQKGMTVQIPTGQTQLDQSNIPLANTANTQTNPAAAEQPQAAEQQQSEGKKTPSSPQEEESPCQKTIARWEEKLDKAFQLIEKQNKVIEGLSTFKESSEKNIAEVRANSKKQRIASIVTLDSTGGNEAERTKRIESLMVLPDEQLDHIMNTYVIPVSNATATSRPQQARGLNQSATLGFRPKVTEMIEEKKPEDANRNLQQSANRVSQKDIDEINELLNFGSIVGNSNDSGGVY